MTDARHEKLASVLIHYSLGIKKGEKLLISGTDLAAPILRAAYREAIRAGAHVHVEVLVDGLREILLKEASEEQLGNLSDYDKYRMEHFDAQLNFLAEHNTKNLSGVDPKRAAMRQAARAPLAARMDERTAAGEFRWCLTLFPTQAHAQDAGMSLSEYEDFVYNAGLLNTEDPVAGWRRVHEEQQRIANYLDKRDLIRIVAPGTDIQYRVKGRKWINADGKVNFPDGEVFSAPIEDSVNGTVRFSYPAIYDGNEVEEVELTFKEGRVFAARAARGLDFLNTMLDMDAGSRYLGEVAFGTNYGIQRFTKEVLFDEKIGGTMHLALGSSYSECGGKNQSGLHWDMVCDLHEGEVYADGELCYEKGRFII